MSRTKPTDLEDAQLEIPCSWCQQPAGAWCRAKRGAWSSYLHAARCWPVWQGYRIGAQETERALLASAISTDQWEQQWWQRRLERARQEQQAS